MDDEIKMEGDFGNISETCDSTSKGCENVISASGDAEFRELSSLIPLSLSPNPLHRQSQSSPTESLQLKFLVKQLKSSNSPFLPSLVPLQVMDDTPSSSSSPPIRLTRVQHKEIKLKKQAAATKAFRERVKAKTTPIRPRKKYARPNSPKKTRKNYVPINNSESSDSLDDNHDEEEDKGNEKDAKSGHQSTSYQCTLEDAIRIFQNRLPEEWANNKLPKFLDCEHDNQSLENYYARPFVRVLQDQDSQLMVNCPEWVSKSAMELNTRPAQRSTIASKKLKLYNAGWKHWLLLQSILSLSKYLDDNEKDARTGQLMQLSLKNIFHASRGIISKMMDALQNDQVGPLLPLPELSTSTELKKTRDIQSQQQQFSKTMQSTSLLSGDWCGTSSTDYCDTPISLSPSNCTCEEVENTMECDADQDLFMDSSSSSIKQCIITHPSVNQISGSINQDQRILQTEPFNRIWNQPQSNQYGKFMNRLVIKNEDMKTLLPGHAIATKIYEVIGAVISEMSSNTSSELSNYSGGKFHFLFYMDLEKATRNMSQYHNSGEDWIRQNARSRIQNLLHKNKKLSSEEMVNLFVIPINNLYNHDSFRDYQLAVVDTKLRTIKIFDPYFDGGVITRNQDVNGSTQLKSQQEMNNNYLWEEITTIGKLFADLNNDNVDLWQPAVNYSCARFESPKCIGVLTKEDQDSSVNCVVYNLIFLEIFGNILNLSKQSPLEYKTQELITGWCNTRRRYFCYITDYMKKHNQLRPQPKTLPTILAEIDPFSQTHRKNKIISVKRKQTGSASQQFSNTQLSSESSILLQHEVNEEVDKGKDSQEEV